MDGGSIVVEASTRPVDWGGKPAVVTTSVDVTEYEAARTALERSEQRFRDIVEASSDWFWEMDQDLRFTFVSERAAEIGGVDATQFLGKTRWESAGVSQDDARWREHRETLEARHPFRDFRYDYDGADGRHHHVSLNGIPVFDGDGRFSGYRGSATDITAEVSAIRKAADARDLFVQALESVPLQFTLYDSEDRLVYQNEAFRSSCALAGRELSLGATFEETLRVWTEGGGIEEAIGDEEAWIKSRMSLHRKPAGTWRMKLLWSDGSEHWFDVNEHRTETGLTLASYLDVTDLVHQEEQLRQALKMEAIGQLTGGVSHDFNNILAVMLGNLDLIMDGLAEDDPLREGITRVIAAAERGATLTQRLLAFSRKQALQPKVLDLNSLVGGMDQFLRQTLGEQIELELVRSGGLWTCQADPSQVENAILNLAINARDAMPDGGKLTIETANAHLDDEYAASQAEITPGQYTMLSVTDTGLGMTEEVKAAIFEPFFSTKEVGRGSGLGLSMVFGFVKQSRGHLTVYSELGEGTTFRIYLPRSKSDERPERRRPLSYEGLEGNGETVLVVGRR